jgi:hypothetical protein
LISCFSLTISCEIKKSSWEHSAMLADFLMPCFLGVSLKIRFQTLITQQELEKSM